MRKRLFEIIEADDPADGYDTASTIYDAVMIILIVLSLLPLTVKEDPPIYTLFERVTVAVFTLDYLLRWATADYKFRESGIMPFLRYPFSPMAIVDLLSILPTLMMIHPAFRLLRVMRLLRALRVLRVIKVVRYSGTIRLLSEVLRESRQPLAAVLSLAVGYIILAALVMFTVEAESFDNYFEAVYWATMSLTTVGSLPPVISGRSTGAWSPRAHMWKCSRHRKSIPKRRKRSDIFSVFCHIRLRTGIELLRG